MNIYKCKYCGAKVHKHTVLYGKGTCLSCSYLDHREDCKCAACKSKREPLTGINHPMFGRRKHGITLCKECHKKYHMAKINKF